MHVSTAANRVIRRPISAWDPVARDRLLSPGQVELAAVEFDGVRPRGRGCPADRQQTAQGAGEPHASQARRPVQHRAGAHVEPGAVNRANDGPPPPPPPPGAAATHRPPPPPPPRTPPLLPAAPTPAHHPT